MATKTIRTAAIMARVSSDEQAKGYSLGVQEESLTKYCEREGIDIMETVREDHSAKDFNRPAFKQFIQRAKKNKGSIDALLFTSWDRFSRNITESLIMIRELRSIGIEPMAIEQPLDLSVPESKAMLALYLAMPEIDNDRRSIKIRGGVRAALKSGRWCRGAPFGYRNSRDDDNKPIIVPNQDAELVKIAFKLCAEGEQQSEIRRVLQQHGKKMPANTLSNMLRNIMYTGKISVPECDDEPATVVNSIHEPLISETLFYKVQMVLDKGRKRLNKPASQSRRFELPLRGALHCSKCGNMLTGSGSRSHTGKRFFYYHCNKCNAERYRADKVNDKVQGIFDQLRFNMDVGELYEAMIKVKQTEDQSKVAKKKSSAEAEIGKIDARLKRLQTLLMDGALDPKDYQEMRKQCEREKEDLKVLTMKNTSDRLDAKKGLKAAIENLINVGKAYGEANLRQKIAILGSTFPEKIFFDGQNCRTQRINEFLALGLLIDRSLHKTKMGQPIKNIVLSRWVIATGFEPMTVCLEGRCSIQLSYATVILYFNSFHETPQPKTVPI